ncbi:unnamed protein product [Victoria cruziana]
MGESTNSGGRRNRDSTGRRNHDNEGGRWQEGFYRTSKCFDHAVAMVLGFASWLERVLLLRRCCCEGAYTEEIHSGNYQLMKTLVNNPSRKIPR